MVVEALKMALRKTDKKYCALSQIDYSRIEMNSSTKELLKEKKYLERPFAYEFYHQLRTLMDNSNVNFGGPIIQAEVDKRYQHCFENGKIPDFIIHMPNDSKNLAVIEFKLANNLGKLEHDFKKLVRFKEIEDLKYSHAIEVIIGNESSLTLAKERIMQLNKHMGLEITIIEFNTDSWEVNDWIIRY